MSLSIKWVNYFFFIMKKRLPITDSFFNRLFLSLIKKHVTPFDLINGNNIDYDDEDNDKYNVSYFTPKLMNNPIPIGFFDKIIWALFGNDLDGPIGDNKWNPKRKDDIAIRIQWWFRNPCHNLTWHVIGFAQYDTVRFDFQKEDGPGWNYAMSYVPDKQSIYPFFLYQGKVWTFYIGWRGRGTFGIKFNK